MPLPGTNFPLAPPTWLCYNRNVLFRTHALLRAIFNHKKTAGQPAGFVKARTGKR